MGGRKEIAILASALAKWYVYVYTRHCWENIAQKYEKKCIYAKKYTKIAFFFKNNWSCQKKAVLLHSLSRRKR